jgi:DNA-binding YbaB/EbfC family protein
MANMFNMMKQVKQMKKMQKELKKKEVEISSNDKTVTVVARGDMTIRSIKIAPEAMDASKVARLEKTLVSTLNGAMDSAKKAAAGDMAKLTEGMGLGDLMG